MFLNALHCAILRGNSQKTINYAQYRSCSSIFPPQSSAVDHLRGSCGGVCVRHVCTAGAAADREAGAAGDWKNAARNPRIQRLGRMAVLLAGSGGWWVCASLFVFFPITLAVPT